MRDAVAHDSLREFYEHEAGTYRVDPESEPAWRHRRDLVRRLLPRAPIVRVLDVGSADGALSVELARWTGALAIGLDVARGRIERAVARERLGRATARAPAARFVQGSVFELPFADASFPLVVCTDLLEHLDDPGLAMAELARVSSRSVIVSVPYSIHIETTLCPHCKREYFLYGHQHSFGTAGLERLAADAGARVVRFEHVIPMFECRRYKLFPPLKWLIWEHFKNTGTLGALIEKVATPARRELGSSVPRAALPQGSASAALQRPASRP